MILELMLKFLFRKSVSIPTLKLSGVIGQVGSLRSGLSISNLDKLIDKLFSDKKCPAVALIINSPGGSPTQSSLIAETDSVPPGVPPVGRLGIIDRFDAWKRKIFACGAGCPT